MNLLARAADSVSRRISRRSFLQKTMLVGTAMAVAPQRLLFEPRSAYAVATRYYCDNGCHTRSPGTCNCGNLCCQGWTEFCCATHPSTGNECPPGTIPAGWWRADGSGLCDVNGQPGPRYYVDCNAVCDSGCGDVSGSTCGGSCHDFPCECAQGDCSYRKTACTRFRYGQCNSSVPYVGAVVCRYVSCTPPWQWDPACNSSPVLYANATASHDRPCLHDAPPVGNYEGIIRLWGSDRYATAVAVSGAHYPDVSNTVFVATGLDYPDALAGSAVAGLLGVPILLVQRDAVPQVTRVELERLSPSSIVILGGTAVVSQTCASQLAGFGAVSRLAGANRYETAVMISQHGHPGQSSTVVVASGHAFADALIGGPLAARLGGPLLLTGNDSLPPATRDEIQRLDPSSILVIGGSGMVSSGVIQELQAYGSVERIDGPDRYATSVEVSQRGFPGSTARVYVAVGTDFPDAISGGAGAANLGSPILMVKRYEVPPVVRNEILRLGPDEIVVLGGTAVIAPETAEELSELL